MIGYRKLFAVILAVVLATAMVYLGRIDGSAYSSIVIAVVGGFLAANVAQKATAKPASE